MKIYRALALITLFGVAQSAPAFAGQSGERQRPDRGDAERRDRQAQMRFRGMDTDGDGVITRAEWRGSVQAFRQQDTNRDGVLSGNEVRAVASQDAPATEEEVRRREATPARSGEMDTDRDGVITRAEWRGGAEAFRQRDTNRDGVLSGTEVRTVAPQDRPATDEETRRREVSARFNRADRNRDERIARAEWTGNATTFTHMDHNADGFVTREEFTAAAADRTAADRAAATSGERPRTPAYRAGYDKGTAEGRQAGKEDRSVNGGRWDLEGQRELEHADSGYALHVGPREEYQAGYRAGFRLGYKEGFGPR